MKGGAALSQLKFLIIMSNFKVAVQSRFSLQKERLMKRKTREILVLTQTTSGVSIKLTTLAILCASMTTKASIHSRSTGSLLDPFSKPLFLL